MITALKYAAQAGYILAATQLCPNQKPLEGVSLEFTNAPPVISNDKTTRELGAYTISTTFSHSENEIFTVGGLRVADFAPQYLVTFDLSDAGKNVVCLAPMRVQLTVRYEPRVMIASEHAPGSCRYKLVLDHEIRHINTDIVTFNEFLPRMRAALESSLAEIPPIGPMQQSSIEKAKDLLMDRIKAALVHEVKEFQKTRMLRQQLIDTRQQYMLESRQCPLKNNP
ncbi:MAG TPA: hypothetical protein VEF76_10785 [Patescibacteria group bacterium]|nr:hypothetical protein [Patescibacteria group bacterium]